MVRIMSYRYSFGLLMVKPDLRSAVFSIQSWNVFQVSSKSSGSIT